MGLHETSKGKMAMAVMAAALTITMPVAADPGGSTAEKVRRLDIMLMVTGLRCRTSRDNFQSDYARFTSNHLTELNAANSAIKAEYVRRNGAAGAQRAMDRISTSMANAYGQGHPWLSCGELRMVTRGLADMRGMAALEEAADQLLAPRGSTGNLAHLGR